MAWELREVNNDWRLHLQLATSVQFPFLRSLCALSCRSHCQDSATGKCKKLCLSCMLHITPRFQSLKFRIVWPTGSGFLQQEVNFAYFQKRFVCTFHVVLRSKCSGTRSKKRFQDGELDEIFSRDFVADSRTMRRANCVLNGGDVAVKSFNEHTTTRLYFILRYLATVQGSLERVTRATFPEDTSFYTDQLESALKSWKTGKKKQNSGTWFIRWLASKPQGSRGASKQFK